MTSLAIFSTINFDVFENQFFLEYYPQEPSHKLFKCLESIRIWHNDFSAYIMDNLNYDGSNDRSSNFFFFFAPGFVKVVLLRF